MRLYRPVVLIAGFLMVAAAARAGQVQTTRPGESNERHLSGDQTFLEWSGDLAATDDSRRIRVCRVETVCEMRFREGNTPRTRVRNLVAPLRYEEPAAPANEFFVTQVRQALSNLQQRRGVTVRFIAFTDDAPLDTNEQVVYGDHLSLSRAVALRVAQSMAATLALPESAIESDGRGAAQPVASNATPQGRASNRRVEVEFWYDDPLQALPEEPQICPGDAQEIVTRIYDPPWGEIAALELLDGQPVIPPGYAATLGRALADIAGRTNARLRFIGYTKNERLDRRTASVYGDDVGLSAARARRAMDALMQDPQLAGARSEHEGRGYVQADDVVSTGFVQGDESYVRVQVVYDEPLPLDDYEGIDITRLTRELSPRSPFELNVMHITVDGEPIDDPNRSSASIRSKKASAPSVPPCS
jgi:flagellar motor protein MotB